MEIARHHGVTHSKLGRGQCQGSALVRRFARRRGGDTARRNGPRMLTKVLGPFIQLVASQEVILEQVELDRGQPPLEVGCSQVVRRVYALDAKAVRVDCEVALTSGDHHQGADPGLPGRTKEWLVRLAHDRTKAMHTAHIVHAVHRLPPVGSPVPVYRSRHGLMSLYWKAAKQQAFV
jgi:hypothetical protein